MKRLTLAIVAGLCSTVLSTPSHAQLFGGGLCAALDPVLGVGPCSTVGTQILQYVRQALQLTQEITTAEQEVINTINLPGELFSSATGTINQLVTLDRQMDLLANAPGAFIGNLSAARYPLPANGMDQVIAEQNAIAIAVQQLGRVINTQLPTLNDASATLDALEREALGTSGRQQTLQDITQTAAAHAQQQHALQAVQIADYQAHHAIMLADQDRRALNYEWANQMAANYVPLDIGGAPGY